METQLGVLLVPLGMGLLVLLYIKNQTIRLDGSGITQGFSRFQKRISYERIARVSTEMRSGRGASTEMLVISGRESKRRVLFPIVNFDRDELIQVIGLIAARAPQARLDKVPRSLTISTESMSDK
jgi:hypothetical protein